MAPDEFEERHTAELKHSREEAEQAVRQLRAQGWDIYPEKVPLQGQWGFYCVCMYQADNGEFYKHAHSVRWNIYEKELRPITVNCRDDADLLSFVWQHAGHDGFDFFEYDDDDIGFVCYCLNPQGCSLALCISADLQLILSNEAIALLQACKGSD